VHRLEFYEIGGEETNDVKLAWADVAGAQLRITDAVPMTVEISASGLCSGGGTGQVVCSLPGSPDEVELHFRLGGGDDRFDGSAFSQGVAPLIRVWVYGDNGNDTLVGAAGSHNRLLGGGHDDMLLGGALDDWLEGGPGDDTLDGGPGKDATHGNAGNDTIFSLDGVAEEPVRCDDLVPDTVEYLEDVAYADPGDLFFDGCDRVLHELPTPPSPADQPGVTGPSPAVGGGASVIPVFGPQSGTRAP